MATLIAHLERHLGPIQHGWSETPDGGSTPFQVAECRGGPLQGISAFVTLGLCRYALPSGLCEHGLRSPGAGESIRHELIITAQTRFGARNIPALLQQVGMEAISRGSAYLRGEVLGPRGCLFEGKPFEALYVALPVFLEDQFTCFETEDGHDAVIAWLVPVTRAEARYVDEQGWEQFERLLLEHDPDLFDFDRASVC